ncbi:MAG: hypothetical protein ACOYCB_13055 [Fastidiosipilaceae bacterium]|jgi:hypothetical protein
MIPSDHFVRFYNEVFKYLDAHGGLEDYFLAISAQQEFHCLEAFRTHGLQGVHDYYVRIRREQNCELDLVMEPGCLQLIMTRCPSLGKAIDNDAGVSPRYCDHCPGWVLPVYTKAGLYIIYDLMGHDQPQCHSWILDDIELARQKLREVEQARPAARLLRNF